MGAKREAQHAEDKCGAAHELFEPFDPTGSAHALGIDTQQPNEGKADEGSEHDAEDGRYEALAERDPTVRATGARCK